MFQIFRSPWLLLPGLLFLTALIYLPGMNGGFILDDYSNITSNENLQIDRLDYQSLKSAALSGTTGQLGRPVSVLSFSINEYITGLDPYWFKMVNLGIHLLCGTSFFLLTILVLRAAACRPGIRIPLQQQQLVALTVSALWLLHPVNLTGVLYVVQRMASLSALFVSLGMCLYIIARLRQIRGKTGFPLMLLAFPGLGLLAFLSKETGALLPVFMLVIEISFFRFQAERPATRVFLIAFFMVSLAIPAVAIISYTAWKPDWFMSSYKIRDFTITDRLFTQARVLWDYIRLIFAPSNQALGLFHDDIIISRGLFSPFSTFMAILSLAGLAGLALYARNRAPLITFGILFFFSGHLLESSVLPLEMMYEHRNYLPGYGILLIIGFYLTTPLISMRTLRVRRAMATILVVSLAYTTATRASIWGDPAELVMMEAENHPASPRANMELGTVYASMSLNSGEKKDELYELSMSYYEKSANLRPSYSAPLFAAIKISCILDKPIKESWTSELYKRLATQPYWGNNVNWIELFGNYQNEMECTIPREIMLNILKSSLGNEKIIPAIRMPLLTSASNYFFSWAGDYDSALYLLELASRETPKDAKPHLHLAILLSAIGRNSDAISELDQAEELDKMGQFGTQIDELRTRLSNLDIQARQ